MTAPARSQSAAINTDTLTAQRATVWMDASALRAAMGGQVRIPSDDEYETASSGAG